MTERLDDLVALTQQYERDMRRIMGDSATFAVVVTPNEHPHNHGLLMGSMGIDDAIKALLAGREFLEQEHAEH